VGSARSGIRRENEVCKQKILKETKEGREQPDWLLGPKGKRIASASLYALLTGGTQNLGWLSGRYARRICKQLFFLVSFLPKRICRLWFLVVFFWFSFLWVFMSSFFSFSSSGALQVSFVF